MPKLDYTKTVFKFLKKLQPKQFKQVTTKMLELAINPTPNDYIKLNGHHEFYRVDVGEYRIIYKFDKETVSIAIIAPRNDDEAYKQLERK